MNTALYVLAGLVAVNVVLFAVRWIMDNSKKADNQVEKNLENIEGSVERLDKSMKDEFQRNRSEQNESSQAARKDQRDGFKEFGSEFEKNINRLNSLLKENFESFKTSQSDLNKHTSDQVKLLHTAVEKQLDSLQKNNAEKLDEIRITVDEKLQKTLNSRLEQSFSTVAKQLQAVQEGLGAMQNIANDVGSLKKVLANVKTRGGFGEVQLEKIIEQILTSDQYAKNVNTKAGSRDHVEFAIKLPGNDDSQKQVWLPIDAKLPTESFEQLETIQEEGSSTDIKKARKAYAATIKNMAKQVSSKYIDPPNTTDFAIMFLSSEGMYAEALREPGLLDTLLQQYNILLAGPGNLAALLNSLRMGFRSLAIQKQSSEVWKILAQIKKEFSLFGGMLTKAHKNIKTGLGQLEVVQGTRTNQINKQLEKVDSLQLVEPASILPAADDSIDSSESEELVEEKTDTEVIE